MMAAAQFVAPMTVTAAVAAAAVVGNAAAARAATGSVLILSTSVNGGSSSVEAQDVPSGYTVTVASPSTWDSMTTAQFASYSAIVIGDPSTGSSCAASVPSDALNTAATWGAAVAGNVAVIGTAPVFAGSPGSPLVKDALAYAVSGPGTGLYVSLNCEYASAPARTGVPLLAGVDGGGFTVSGQGSACPASGSVNTWVAEANTPFNGLAGSQIGPWVSPACAVEETLNSWPAGLSGLAYLPMTGSGADFTASDGAAGQAYVVVGAAPGTATQALSPSVFGEVLPASTTGGSNPAAPGVASSVTDAADGVNAADGDFTQSSTDVSVPGFGPGLDFTRTYDAQLARQQTVAGVAGPMGYGWTDNWATSLSQGSPVPGDIYTLDGLATVTGEGGPPTGAALNFPGRVVLNGSDIYIVDTSGNRIEEIAGATKTQWGQPMTAGDIYTIAGSDTGAAGASAAGTAADASKLNGPGGIAFDGAGDLVIADTGNCRVMEIPVADGTYWGQSMSANDLYRIAGRTGGCAVGDDNKAATESDLDAPADVRMAGGNLYIADSSNNRIQEVAGSSGSQWGQPMTQFDVYTVAGSAAGTPGGSGDGGAAAAAFLNSPMGLWLNSGDLYIADTGNDRIQEAAGSSGSQWGQPMTAFDVYTIAGRTGQQAVGNDDKPATQSDLAQPWEVRINSGNLFIADTDNNRIQEVAGSTHTEWGQSMTQFDVYTVAGSAAGTAGYSGNGGQSVSALLSEPEGIALGATNSLLIADTGNNEIRRVDSSTAVIGLLAGGVGSFGQGGDGGPAVNAGLDTPAGVASDAHGDIFIADSGSARVQEIAAYTHTQFGIAMTAGDVYTVAGSAAGFAGVAGDGGPATSAFLGGPDAVAADNAGNLYIADTINNRIQKVSAQTGDISTIAGSAAGASGDSGDGGPATSALLHFPQQLAVNAAGDIFIADSDNNQVREVPAASGNGMTAGDIYTIAGSTAGTIGTTGDRGPASSALLNFPYGVSADASGNLYIADDGNNRIQEIAATSHTQWGQAMTAGDIYTIAGNTTGTQGNTGDGGPATSALLDGPSNIAVDPSGNLYIADTFNNRYREVAAANGTQWGQAMTAGHIYNVAGSASANTGNSGDGGPATSALLNEPLGVATDPFGNLFITDFNNRLREVTATTTSTFAFSPQGPGITITQPGGAQVTYYPQTGGSCTSPYIAAGSYCTLPQNVAATLSYNSSTGVYTFTPQPGTSYTYNPGGSLTSISDAAGNTLTVSYGTPMPGSGNCPTSANWCETITAANGRTLVIGDNSAGEPTSVTDPMGRTWKYAYSSGDLASVTDPMGNITSYTYGQGSTGNPQLANDLLTITKPNAQPGGPDAGDATINIYNASGRITSQTDPMGYRTTLDYSGLNTSTGTGFVRVSGPDGNTTVYSYNQGAQTSEADWTGTTLTSEQDFGPDLTATGTNGGTLLNTWTADGNAKITSYTYDSAGNVTSVTDPLGHETTDWSTSLNQTRCAATAEAVATCSSSQTGPAPVPSGGVITPPSTAPPSGVVYTQYDTDGNQLWTDTGVYQPGASTASYAQITYQLFKGNSLTLNGKTITCNATPPSASLPCAIINADGVVTQLAYDTQGDLTSTSTPDGNGSELSTTTYIYDGDGEQTATTSPDGNLTGANAGNYTTTTAYNADGGKTTVTQADGSGATTTSRTTIYGYDADGNQTTAQDARGYTTTTTYNADDQATLVTDPDGNATLTCYDGDANLAQTVPPVGVAANSLTPTSCPTAYPAGYSTRLASDTTVDTFDALGQKTQETSPAPAGHSGYETTAYTYDGNGNLTKTTAPPATNNGPNEVTVDTYNSAGLLAAETTGYGTSVASTVSYCYNPNGEQTSVVYPDGNTSGVAACETSSPWVVNPSFYPTQAASQTTSSYDSVGDLVSTAAPSTAAAPSGATTSYTYDAEGNTLSRTDPGGVITVWTYTPLGKPSSVSYSGSSTHGVTYSYDADGQRIGMSDATGTSTYSYDPFGELISTINGAGQTIRYGYDSNGNNTSITYPLPTTATWASTNSVTYGYDHADQLTSVTDFNGNKITVSNTVDGLPESLTLGTTGDTIYRSYDNTDSPSVVALKNGATTLESFTYADAPAGDILSETDVPSSSQSPAAYTYDSQGRVTSMTPGTESVLNYSFDESSNPTELPTGASASYDNGGELTSSTLAGTTTTYTYNADGQRLSAKQGSTTTATGTWDAADRLTAYSNDAADMSTATYDGDGLRASTTITPAGKSAVTQRYVWNTVQVIPSMIMDSSKAYIYGNGIAPVEQVDLSTGATTYLVTDYIQSVRGTVNDSGILTATVNYDAWGNPEGNGGLTAMTPFGFAGGYTDPTGMTYLINRYYDPGTAQFISIDSLVGQTHELYQYASGNPVNLSDPSGLETWSFGHHGCRFRIDRPHWSDSVANAIKVNGGVVDCTAKPAYASIRLRLWKQGAIVAHLEAEYTVDSNKKPFREVKSKYRLLNQGTYRRCLNKSVVSYFFGSILAKATEDGAHYYTPDWPQDTVDPYVFKADCYTSS